MGMLLDLLTGRFAKALGLMFVVTALAGYVFQRGVQSCQAEQARLALVHEQQRQRDVSDAMAQGKTATDKLAQERRAWALERRNWKGQLDATPNAALVDLPASAAGAGDPPGPAGALHLSGVFVGLYNDAWCAAGDAVSAAACRAAAGAAGATTADPRAVLAHTEAEAATCGEDRMVLDRLTRLLQQPPWSARGPAHVD